MVRVLIYVLFLIQSNVILSQDYFEEKNIQSLIEIEEDITPIFRCYEIPEPLMVISIVESTINPNAISDKGAVGLWQLTTTTAKMNGLVVNSCNDERKDIIKSTTGACKYLKYLYNRFQNWDIVVIAWNWGETNVNSLIKLGYSFNEMKDKIPQETRNFHHRVSKYGEYYINYHNRKNEN